MMRSLFKKTLLTPSPRSTQSLTFLPITQFLSGVWNLDTFCPLSSTFRDV